LAGEKRLGTNKSQGAARLKIKTVAEMQKNVAEAKRNAGAANKAGITANAGKKENMNIL